MPSDPSPPTTDDDGAGDRPVRLADDDLRRALDRAATEIVLFISPTGKVLSSNRLVNLGWDEQEQTGSHIAEHLHPDDLLLVFDVIERARVTPGFEEVITVRARHRDGHWLTFECTVLDARVAHPDLVGAVIRAREVTAPSPTAAALESSTASHDERDRFLSLAEAVPLGILSADARGWVVFSNEAAARLFDLPAADLNGEGWVRAVHEEDRDDVRRAAEGVIRTASPQEVTFRLATGLFVRWAHARFVPLGHGERRTGWIATVDDETERRRAQSELAHQATHDSLTNLPNRALLEDRLRQACHRLRRDASPLSVLFVDLDGFKGVNDEHGHAAGDRVLAEVARRLRHVVRDVDTVARLGGDEFVVVCEGIDDQEATEVGRRIEDSLLVPMIAGGRTVRIGCSVGTVSTVDPGVDVAELLNRADQAMYRVKQQHHAVG